MRTAGIGRVFQQVGGMMRGGSRGGGRTGRRSSGRATTRRPAAGTRRGRPVASGGGLGGIVRRFLR